MTAKALVWVGTSLADVRQFPPEVRRNVGFQLWRIQLGLEPNDWKPMPSIGVGVREVRVHAENEHRVFYVSRLEDAIYVLHAFEKRTRKTARRDLALARSRLSQLVRTRVARRPPR